MTENTIDTAEYTVDCAGAVCVGDTVSIKEAIFLNTFAGFVYNGERQFTAHVVGESFGKKLGTHSFSLRVIASEGDEALAPGKRISRQAKNVWREGTKRKPWADEAARETELAAMHARIVEVRQRHENFRAHCRAWTRGEISGPWPTLP